MNRLMIITGLSFTIILMSAAFLFPNRGGGGGEGEKKAPVKSTVVKKEEEKKTPERKEEVKKQEMKQEKKKVSKVKFDYKDFGRGMPEPEEFMLDTMKTDTVSKLP
ncbi:MAG: hypothetical protein ACKOXB_07385 [Flavobacteriales bacterium]